MARRESLRGIGLIRFLARRLPEFWGRNRLLLSLGAVLNKEWPERAAYTSPQGLHYELNLTDLGGYRSFFLLGRLEADVTWAIDHLLSPGDMVIEAGTGVGVYTVHAAQSVGSAGQVHGFEPLPAAYEATRRHVEMNGFRNVVLNRSAVGADEGTATLYSFAHLPQGHASLADLGCPRSTSHVCTVTTIDRYVQEKSIDHVRFVKLDVEGSELPALRGGMQTISEMRPIVIAEANFDTSAAFGYQPQDVVAWFGRLHYAGFVLRRQKWVEIVSDVELRHGDNILFVWEQDLHGLRILRAWL